MKRERHQQRLYRKSREIPESGRNNGWFHIAGELSQRGPPLALALLDEEPVRQELDRLCAAARSA